MAPYHMPPPKLLELRRQLQDLLETGTFNLLKPLIVTDLISKEERWVATLMH